MWKMVISALLISLVFSGLKGQSYTEINKAGLLELLKVESDTTMVINFWATWCSPCVKEIEYFEELHRERSEIETRVILVSLDFPNQAERRLTPFLNEKGISAQVVLMTDMNYNDWIDQVDPSWSGAIPATIIFNRNKKVFLEQELSKEELFTHVKQISN